MNLDRCPKVRRKLTQQELQDREAVCERCKAPVRVVPNQATGEATLAAHGGRHGLQNRRVLARAPKRAQKPVQTVAEWAEREQQRAREAVHVTADRLPALGAPEKRGVLDSPALRRWVVENVCCELAGLGYCACIGAGRRADPHHVASRGAHGRQDLLVVALCREAHDAAHAGHVPAVEVEAAAYRTQRAFWLRAPAAVRRKALQEMEAGIP